MINNRQSGRRRGRGGGNGGGQRQGGGQQGNGSRIDSRARGNASQLYEKYKNMAADAQRAGDRVNTEYYLQFSDHYFRVLSEQRGRFEDQQPQQRARRDEFDMDGDDEFGDEGEPIRAGEQGDQPRANGGDSDRGERRPSDMRGEPRGGEFRRDRESGDGRPDRNDGNRAEGGRREWRDRNDRGDQRRNGEYREPRPAEPELVAGQHRAEPVGAGESLERRAEEVLESDRPLDPPARRRGRPRRDDGADGGDAHAAAFEADRLPPSLTVAANDEGAAEPKPRRRLRRPAEDTPTAAE